MLSGTVEEHRAVEEIFMRTEKVKVPKQFSPRMEGQAEWLNVNKENEWKITHKHGLHVNTVKHTDIILCFINIVCCI